ncbi:MAG: hypothetical protein C5B51_18290 [Terriglobia bacterium]|nr:MAG: hypothetical protein C5B51_18290 [Terriglobia bacterium]
MRKVFAVGILMSGLVLLSIEPATRHRIAASTRNFEQSFADLRTAGKLNPVERLVFSLVLASAHADPGAN